MGADEDNLSAAPAAAGDTVERLLARVVAAPPTLPDLAPHTVVAEHYEVERLLGAGGMGAVYLARDRSLDRIVALKLHRTPTARDRLHREALAMAKLASPNVVTVFEIGEYEGRPFVAMEYVAGANLRAWLDAAPRTPRAIVAALCAAGAGLVAAHAAGLVHRDVKPDNIFVGDDGRVRVGDFGLAQLALATSTPDLPAGDLPAGALATESHVLLGTPAYMAPEQIDGQLTDARSDQFAFCVTLWEALYGVRPFVGETLAELRAAIARGEPAVARTRVSAPLRRAIARGLAEDPAKRWPSMTALLAALRRAERRPRVLAATAAGVVAAAAIAAYVAWPAPDPAQACAARGGEIDELLPEAQVAAAIAASARGGGPSAALEAKQLAQFATSYRTNYRGLARAACEAEARGQWTAAMGAASRECAELHARTARAMFDIAPTAATQPSDVLPIVARVPTLIECAEPRVLASWRWLDQGAHGGVAAVVTHAANAVRAPRLVPAVAGSDTAPGANPDENPGAMPGASIDARARLEAAAEIVELGQIASARAIAGDPAIAASAQHDPDVARRLAFLRAALASAAGDFATAERGFGDVYDDARIAEDTDAVLATLRALVDLVSDIRHDRDETERWVRESVVAAQRYQVEAPARVFVLMLSAALALDDAGDHEHALQLCDRAEQARPDDESRALELAAVRASALAGAGKLDAAAALAGQIVDRTRALVGPAHPRLAAALAQQSQILFDGGHEADGLVAARAASKILEENAVDRGTAVGLAAFQLGVALLKYNDDAGAEADLRRARAIFVVAHGEDHPDVALVDVNLALIANDRGDTKAADAMLRRATAIQERTLGPEHEELAAGLYNLSVVERDAGELADALAAAQRCVKIEATHDPGSERHIAALLNTALVLNRLGRYADALATVAQATALPAQDDNARAWSEVETGHALSGLHHPAEARAHLERGRAMYVQLGLTARADEAAHLLSAVR